MIVKVQVHLEGSGQRVDHEYDMNRDESLATHIANIHTLLQAPGNIVDYLLQLESTKHYLEDTDLSKPEFSIPNGAAITLKLRPGRAVAQTLQALQNENLMVKKKAIFDVRNLLKDEAFAKEFLAQEGIKHVVQLVSETSGNMLAYGLSALQSAMSYGVGLDTISSDFIDKVVTFVDSTNINVCRSALEILIYLSNSPKHGFRTIEISFNAVAQAQQKPPFANLVVLLDSLDVNIQSNAMSLINSLTTKVANSPEYATFMSTLNSLNINEYLKKNAGTSDSEFRKQIYLYQRNRLKELKELRERPYQKDNAEHEDLLMSLWKTTYPNVNLETRVSEQWKLMGFQGTDPATDFRGMGYLGLKNLVYIAETYSEKWRKIVTVQAERKERDYPVAVAGINITGMLFDLLQINKEPNPESGQIFQVLFDHPKAFEEIYCIALQILDVTWDEMEASYMDFPKVIAAVKKKISDALQANYSSLDQFQKAAMSDGPKNQPGANQEEEVPEPKPIRELRLKLRQEMTELIKQQKMGYLSAGAFFRIYKPKGKQPPFIFYRLSANKQELHFVHCQSADTLPTDLPGVVKLDECTGDMLVRANTPIFAKQKKIPQQEEEMASLSFALAMKEAGKYVEFTALNKDDFLNWTDGLRVLMTGKVENPETLDELKTLTNFELRIRLLELEGIELPLEEPKIPDPPEVLASSSKDKISNV